MASAATGSGARPPRPASAAPVSPRRPAASRPRSGPRRAWTSTRSRSWISTITSKVGGCLRSSTLFCERRRRASSSPRVTLWIPPIRSDSVGLSIRLSRLLPCAVPISWTPRSAIVRAACASSSVPISSMTMTSGMWFSTASIITSCWSDGRPHLHPPRLADRRVRDVAVAGDLVGRVDHDHALALLVGEHAGGLAEHRRLADAGPAHDQDRLPGLHEVRDDLDRPVDRAPDPAGQAHDLAAPVADRADAVERALDAGAVVVPEHPDVVDDVRDVRLRDLALEEGHLARRVAGLGLAAQVEDDLDQRLPVGQGVDRLHDLRRQRREEDVEIVGRCLLPLVRIPPWLTSLCPSADAGRHEARFGDADEGFLHQERDDGDRVEALLLEPPVHRRLVGSDGREHPLAVRRRGTPRARR